MRNQPTRRVEQLSQAECLTLLAARRIGRLALTDRALPSIRPMRYSLLGPKVILRVDPDDPGPQLDGQVVAFAVDELDEESGSGWGVVVTGRVEVVQGRGELLRLEPDAVTSRSSTQVCFLQGTIAGRRYGPDS